MSWKILYRLTATATFLLYVADFVEIEVAIFFMLGAIFEQLEKKV